MNGAESLVRCLAGAGVDVCFANPGTTEMPLVEALDRVPEVRPVLGLFEGVCTGAADGYGRMAGRPAMTLLHLGPGLANGIANLHNARRARTPVVNIVGDHATWHLAADAPLTTDIPSLAAPVSGWVRTATSADTLAADGADAVAASLRGAGQVATLIVPADCQWGPVGDAPSEGPERFGTSASSGDTFLPNLSATAAPVAEETVAEVAGLLASGERRVLLLGGAALGEQGLRAAARVAGATGCHLMTETFPARLQRGGGLPSPERLPYFPEQAVAALAGTTHLVLAGTTEPVAFFAYPAQPSSLVPDGTGVHRLGGPGDDVEDALERLAERVVSARTGAPTAPTVPVAAPAPAPPSGASALTPALLGAVLAAMQPEGAIVVDEAATSGQPWLRASEGAPRHTVLSLTGGAIGQGLPCATGAAVACPGPKVVAFQADGSGMYTVQSLWTQAREGLDVVTLVCANRRYRILQVEQARAGVVEPGPASRALTDLSGPPLDWVAMATGMGVPAGRAATVDELVAELGRALAEPGPRLVEAVL